MKSPKAQLVNKYEKIKAITFDLKKTIEIFK